MRQLFSRLFCPRFLLVSLFLTAATLCAPAVRADETVRRMQEELRKRNLYYGDIDGQRSRSLLGALRRYQERKGFPATGEPDEITLRSLNIEPPTASSAEEENSTLVSNSHSWPTGTVLKSDRARRSAASSSAEDNANDKDLFSNSVTNFSIQDGGSPPAGSPADEPTGAPSISPPPASATVVRPPATRPPRPAVQKPLSIDAARRFINDYLRASETNRVGNEAKFYADRVNYFDQGMVGRAFIVRDVQRYYRRWPRRHFELLEPLVLAPGPHEEESTVRFLVRFRYDGKDGRGQPVHVEGKTDNIFILQGTEPDDLRIVAMRERRMRS